MTSRNNDKIQRSFTTVFLSLGSNLGDRLNYLKEARTRLEDRLNKGKEGIGSSIYATAAWGDTDQDSFLNQVLKLDLIEWDSGTVLKTCLDIENDLGRVRIKKWGPRTIDIDILFFDKEIVNTNNLIIPHSEIQNRRFILQPMIELEPDFVHPVFNKTMIQLMEECLDPLSVQIYTSKFF